MKIPACLLTLVLASALVAILPGLASAGDGIPGVPATSLPGDRRDAPQGTPPAQALPPGENYRANYFTDYHANPGSDTQAAPMVGDSPANIRDSIGRRDADSSQRDPFARELSAFRGEMSIWRR